MFLRFLLSLAGLSQCYGQYNYVVYVMEGNWTSPEELNPVWECDATGASFGFQLPSDKELIACAQAVTPHNACNGTLSPEEPRRNLTSPCPDYFAIADRGDCPFATKAKNVENALNPAIPHLPYFKGLIIANYDNQSLNPMSGQDELDIGIPVYMISHRCAEQIQTLFPFNKGYYVVVRNAGLGSIVRYLVPFIVVLGVAFLILLVITVVKFIRDRRKRQKRLLSSRNLRKIPTKKYKRLKDAEAETCPICLDDFEDGEKLRILPCNHVYHCKCIDPWLTKNRKVCPVCKRKVCPSKDDSTDSDSEDTRTATNSSNVDPSSTSDVDQLIPPDEPIPVPGPSRLARVLPGFLRRSPPPVALPPPNEIGQAENGAAENSGFDSLPETEETPRTEVRQPRRKRHPANSRNVPKPKNTKMSLVRSPADEAETSGAGEARNRALTHVPPGPHAIDNQPTRHNRQQIPASAPAHLKDRTMDDDEDIDQRERQREDSIAIDLDQPNSNQLL